VPYTWQKLRDLTYLSELPPTLRHNKRYM